jgi:hypothetical protein
MKINLLARSKNAFGVVSSTAYDEWAIQPIGGPGSYIMASIRKAPRSAYSTAKKIARKKWIQKGSFMY